MEKRFSVKLEMLAIVIVPSVILSAVMLFAGIGFMKAGMEKEILRGLLSSAYAYRDIACDQTDRDAGDSGTETALREKSGYDFTWFEGDTRKNSSLGSAVIGTKAADEVINEVIGKGNVFTSTNTQVAGTPYFVAYVPVKDDSGKVTAMAFTGVSRESVRSQLTKYVLVILFIGVTCLGIAVFLASFLANKMAEAISLMNSSIRHLSKGEYVKIDKYLERGDEIGAALNDTNTLIENIDEEKRNREKLIEALEINNARLWTISKMFLAAYEVDIADDSFTQIKEGLGEVRDIIGDQQANAKAVMKKVMSGLTDEAYRDAVLDFVDFDTLGERMRDKDTVSTEYLTSDGQWKRARFIVSHSGQDGTVERVMFLIENIDRGKEEPGQSDGGP